MADQLYPFTNPANYVYDSAKIEVAGGLAQLKSILMSTYAHWHLNESAGATALDSSGNGRDGTLIQMEDVDWMAGKLSNCLYFDGRNEYVECGNIAGFERTDEFSLEAWFRVLNVAKDMMIVSRFNETDWQGYRLFINEFNELAFTLATLDGNIIGVAPGTYDDDNWHHLAFTYDGSSDGSGIKIYVDSVSLTTVIHENTMSSGSMITPVTTFQIAAMNGITDFKGYLDEVVIYELVLNQSQVSFRYNSGSGTEDLPPAGYPLDKPTIKPTSSWEPLGVVSYTAFSEVLGGSNEGNVAYQLSDDDGANWRYWNGSTWAITTGEDYNDAATVHANIDQFPIGNEKIMFKAFLISDGSQKVELDSVEISASLGDPSIVYAGTDKNCYDHEEKKPFSDCTISDPDGDIENAAALYDIEGSGWTQILKGGYGTLQEAIRNFQYLFDNSGQVLCQLKIIDEQAKETIDSMTMTVSKYTVTFNVKNEEGSHLPNISCNFDDGQSWQIKHSPFTYDFDWKPTNYNCFFDKAGYIIQSILVVSSIHTENITLLIPLVDPAEIADAVWDETKADHVAPGSFGKTTGDIETEANKIQPEILEKKDEFKADINELALEATSQEIKDIVMFLKNVESGCWEIKDNQMIIYKEDHLELLRFNLFDKLGKRTEKNVFKRVRI